MNIFSVLSLPIFSERAKQLLKYIEFQNSDQTCIIQFYAAIPSEWKGDVFLLGGFGENGQWGTLLKMKSFK